MFDIKKYHYPSVKNYCYFNNNNEKNIKLEKKLAFEIKIFVNSLISLISVYKMQKLFLRSTEASQKHLAPFLAYIFIQRAQ